MFTASCLCGRCSLEIKSVVGTGFCHCVTCRKMTSSLFSMNAVVLTSDFNLKSGEPKTIEIVGNSGTESTLNFCGDCGSALWIDWRPRPDLKVVKAGILDGNEVMDRIELRPQVEQFTARRPSWMSPVSGAEQEIGQQRFGTDDAKEDHESDKGKF